MATKKNVDEEAIQPAINKTEVADTVETVDTGVVEKEQEAEASVVETPETKPKKKAVKTEIPENIRKILEMMTDYEELYIDNKGGMFTIDTKPELRKGAILYKNPYFEQ